jgi:elongation factor P
MAETINTSQFRNGMHIELESQVWRILEFQHVKPGKGGAFVRTKLRNIDSGKVVDKTFRAGEKMPRVHTETKNVQYLYEQGDEVVFMEQDTFEQITFPRADVEDELEFLQPSATAQMLAVDGRPAGIQAPDTVELSVAETEPGVKGDTVSNVTKPATLETGAVVQVPLFVNEGDRIKVDTRERRYISRV